MPSARHEAQNLHAARWLKKQGFSVVATNIRAAQSREIVDVIGFRDSCSMVIESKVSRGDYLADAKKPERAEGAAALGVYRAYICPEGLITPDEIPTGWMLLYSNGKCVTTAFKPKGNIWPPPENDSGVACPWKDYQHPVNSRAERAMLFSLCRRLVAGKPILN